MPSGSRILATPDGPMRCYEAIPDGPSASTDAPPGAVLVIQEAFGVNPHIEDATRRFATAGYHAIAPDLFHRAGGSDADRIVEYGTWEKVLELFKYVRGDDDVLADVDAALGRLHEAGFADDRISIVGFCFGGRVTFMVALHRALAAAVGFYGGGIVTGRFPQFPPLVERSASLHTPWLGLFGDEDSSIPVEDVERLRSALKAAPVETEIVRYPGAKHGFHCDVRADYDAAAATDAWNRTLAWITAHS